MNSIMKVLYTDTEVSEASTPPQVISGKVRDRWDIGNDLLCFYHSDRLSSFDRHICNIDGKGRLFKSY